jgi:hypothetical protein
MKGDTFNPAVFVYHERGAPVPLLPLDYTPFKMIDLPPGLKARRLSTQLAVVQQIIEGKAAQWQSSPFGAIVGYEFAWRNNVSVFLNAEGEFASDCEPPNGLEDRNGKKTSSKSISDHYPNREYVIGVTDDGFFSIVAEPDEHADDRDLTFARHFTSLADAQAAALEAGVNVFQVVKEGGEEKLREILVDLHLAETKPFDGCYKVADRFWAGPTFLTANPSETDERLGALSEAGVTCFVSIIDSNDTFLIPLLTELVANSGVFRTDQFEHNFFAIEDRQAPSKWQTKILLDVVDAAYLQGKTTYLHCAGGRGRAACVAASWLVRHGVVLGQAALDELMELRCTSGVFGESPETESQRQRVINWEEGN